MIGGILRILDADGSVVASDVTVAADGRYTNVPLTGKSPWRIEACGHTGEVYQCLQSIAQSGGTANVTPLTTAMLVLGTNQSPKALMTGSNTPDAGALAAAQELLRTGLASLIAQSGLPASLDLVTATLAAGARTGYDRLLDSVGINTGVDDTPFVQISPRLGQDNLYLQTGQAAAGQITLASQADQLALQGLETLFANLSNALRSAEACADPTTGVANFIATRATLNADGDQTATGPAQIAAAMCGFFAGGDGEPSRFGSHLTSPRLGRCDFTGTEPLCGVSFAIQDTKGEIEEVGDDMSVIYQDGAWKFNGQRLAIPIHAHAQVQRDHRIDDGTALTSFSRALSFEIPALPGIACARVAQRSADSTPVTLAYYKRHASGTPRSLSAWRSANDGGSRSLEPSSGLTRSDDDTWLMLPQGTEGDTAIRNFLRGGRHVTVSLYSDASCSVPYVIGGRSNFMVDLEGIPPVWAQLQNLPWPTLTADSSAALRKLNLAATASGVFSAQWTYERGHIGLRQASLCSDRASCGEDGAGRIGEHRIRHRAFSVALPLRTGAQALETNGYKMLALYGRTRDGLGIQSNHMSCPGIATGRSCEQ